MKVNDNINTVGDLQWYKKLAKKKEKYYLYRSDDGPSWDPVSEAKLYREAENPSSLILKTLADVIDLKNGDISDVSVDLNFSVYVSTDSVLEDGYCKDDADVLKNYVGFSIDRITGHLESGEKFVVESYDDSVLENGKSVIDGVMHSTIFTDLVIGLNSHGLTLDGDSDFNEISNKVLSGKMAIGSVSYGKEEKKVMVKSTK